MATETSPKPGAQPAAPKPLPTALPGRAKLWIAILAVAAVGLVAWLLVRASHEEQKLEDWDVYGELRAAGEWEEMFFEGDAALYQAARDKYVRQLEAFVADVKARGGQATLEAQARWRMVKTEGDSLLSMKDVLDVAKRLPHTENAIKQLEVLEKEFPSFPLNWGKEFAPPGFANTTRRLVDWFKKNAEWEKEHLPRDRAPDAGVTVVLRTEAGDLRLGLYAADAPQATARFLAAVQSGALDGTCFTARQEETFGGETRVAAVRAGDARSRGAKPYDTQDALRFVNDEERERFLPEESRNRVLHLRGVVSAWHPDGDEYDDPQQLLFVVRTSPGMDYAYTPIGRLLDTASLDTLDRIYARKPWRDDPLVARDTGELRKLEDVFQVPVAIVKALAYKDGQLFAGDVKPLATKAAVDASEQSLAGLKADAYKVEPPAPPAAPTPVK